MGKRLIQQARGSGGPTYRAPSFRYQGRAAHHPLNPQPLVGKIIDLITCQGHSAPLARVQYEDGKTCLLLAADGLRVGDVVTSGSNAAVERGNTLPLTQIPEGTLIYNIEQRPGDGGKFCRASGTFARVLSKAINQVLVELPSKKQKMFHQECRANIGIIAGAGRLEKPFYKAGNKFYAKLKKNKLYPIVAGSSMNATDHPFGNSRSSRKSKARPAPHNAPPGRNVGMIRPRRTGRKK